MNNEFRLLKYIHIYIQQIYIYIYNMAVKPNIINKLQIFRVRK